MNQFCETKGIKGDFSVARTPQQNEVAKKKIRTLIEVVRTMLADSKLPTTFWAEAVNTTCYVKNRVLVTKPHNKTPYKLFLGRKPALGFMRPFGCLVTILNTIDHLGKFDGKADEGFFVGYSTNSTKACNDIGKARMETVPGKDYILLPLWLDDPLLSQSSKSFPDDGFKPSCDVEKNVTKEPGKECGDSSSDQEKEDNVNNTNNVNASSTNEVNVIGVKTSIELPDDPNMPKLEDIVYSDDDEDVGAEADMNNLDAFVPVNPILTTRIHKDHSVEQIIRDLNLAPQTRRMTKNLKEHGLRTQKGNSYIKGYNLDRGYARRASTIQATRSLDFSGFTKWKKKVFRNKKDERGIVIKNKARLVAPRYTQEEGIDYDEMDVKSAFIYGKTEEEVYVCQPPEFEDPDFLDRKGQRLQVKQKKDRIFISQNKYVTEILKIFGFTDVKTASTPMETQKPLLKDEDGEEVDVHLYRLMIGSLMYLTSSRPDIMFVVCACARYQVNPKVSHLHDVKRIFKYLKGQPNLGLWYLKDSSFDLVAYTDSDYAGASLDRKSTTRDCQFLGCRLSSWQCKKQTVVANSTTKAEYVAASSCCGQVLWTQNQLLDYGYNFMNTKIYIDNKSTICIVKNPVFH
ncbi:putative ribonuclease H-like domain-containing protein [Tanacetum coccineum]